MHTIPITSLALSQSASNKFSSINMIMLRRIASGFVSQEGFGDNDHSARSRKRLDHRFTENILL